MTEALARVEDLHHGFGGVPALRGFSTTIAPGIITGLIRPDAAGKTTLLRLLAGLLRPEHGRITVLGHDMSTDATRAHASIGYMPQRFGLYEDLSVAENLDLFADLHSLPRTIRTERSVRLLRFTGLARFVTRLTGQLSGSMKQKLGLACALLARPRLLLLDEPSVGVDPASRRELWAIVAAVLEEGRAEGMAVIWATTYLDEAARCGRVLLLHEGSLLADLPPASLMAPLQGRVFRLTVPDGTRRMVATRAAADPDVLDAVMEGDAVRLVLRKRALPPDPSKFGGLTLSPLSPRFEDCFVDRLGGQPYAAPPVLPVRPQTTPGPAIDVHDLVRKFKQRLALATALLHGPDILFLDEPTSGVDPVSRRAFWARIGALADSGVAVLVTSHFMDEAEYCDRLGIVSEGKLIATGTPADLRAQVRTSALPDPTLEDAFIALVQAVNSRDQAA